MEFLIFVLGCGWWKDSIKIFICSCRVGGGWGGGWLVVVGGPSNFIVNQSPNHLILGLEILDLNFGLDNKPLLERNQVIVAWLFRH